MGFFDKFFNHNMSNGQQQGQNGAHDGSGMTGGAANLTNADFSDDDFFSDIESWGERIVKR